MTGLEDRYRVLFAWYPAEHRARHEEEMIAVLLASARPGQTRPGLRDAADLLLGAVRIRLRHAFGPGSAPLWRDALNAAAVVAPLSLLVTGLGSAAGLLASASGLPPSYTVVQLAFLLPQALIVVLALRGPRWGAAACAWLWAVAETTVSVWAILDAIASLGPDTYSVQPLTAGMAAERAGPLVFSALLLTAAPDPASGARSIGHRTLLRWSVATVTALGAVSVLSLLTAPGLGLTGLTLPLLAAMACGVASRHAAGRRGIALLAPLLLFVTGHRLADPLSSGRPFVLAVEAMLLALAFVLARRGFRPYGSGTVSSPDRLA
ncbi:hypothetical protein [Planomonospora parontospora]|uniref:hypothetical protein n=1 Tax=Planomonospora parontospora TaxID=58119 RepID=UPI0016714A27|nr:hypothetical protein [Planomonospora parontospora]GGL44940.1 hypothetical protein GCM10014719_52900 [Planomonospora parontospora subsp. antibiotica]GII13789.1 hypothetical protein Ppa05_05150 [Planomonospora parontospora subsp. antibiotica]